MRLVAAALALLMTLQAIAAATLATLGPLHTHRAAPAIVVLDDARRGPPHGPSAEAQAVRRHGHSHGGASTLRHHHAPGDTSVVLADGEAALHAGDLDDSGAGAALGALIGLVPSVVPWLPLGPPDVAATRRAWVPQTHLPEFPERPPRTA